MILSEAAPEGTFHGGHDKALFDLFDCCLTGVLNLSLCWLLTNSIIYTYLLDVCLTVV